MRPEAVFAQYLSVDPTTIEEMISKQKFHFMKVCELKEILRYYKDHGHPHLSTTQNKSGLIETLAWIVNKEMEVKTPKSSSASTSLPGGGNQTGDDQIKRSVSAQNPNSYPPPPPPTSMLKMRHLIGSRIPTLPPPCSSSLHTGLESEDEDADEEQHELLPPPSTLPKSPPMTLQEVILLNPLNRRVFAELQMSSFSPNQILEAIKENYTTPDSILDFDLLMLAILNHVEPAVPVPSFDEESFNRDLDLAILNSEGEREAIQSRKKRRKVEVQTEKGVSLLSAEEFRGSALLGKRKSVCDDNMSSSTKNLLENGSRLIQSLLARLDSDEKKVLLREQTTQPQSATQTTSDIPSSLLASSATLPSNSSSASPFASSALTQSHSLPSFPIRQSPPSTLPCTQQHPASSPDSSSVSSSTLSLFQCCDCSCSDCTLASPLLSELRASLSSLLYLEADAYRWYKDDSIPYFLKLGSRIDQLLTDETLLSSYTSSSSSSAPSSGCSSGDSSVAPHCPSTSWLSAVVPLHVIPALKVEIEAVTRILLLFPTGCAGGIPEEFRKVDPEGMGQKWQLKAYDIEDDGFEIL